MSSMSKFGMDTGILSLQKSNTALRRFARPRS